MTHQTRNSKLMVAFGGLLLLSLGFQCSGDPLAVPSDSLPPALLQPPIRAYSPDTLPNQHRHQDPITVQLGTSQVMRANAQTPAGIASGPPLAADLAETPDVRLTPEAAALATSLGNDPIAIFDHVRNEFDVEPFYAGSVKGSQETLVQKGGNDIDLASTLLALLRSAGVPSRYVQGRVRMPIADALAWTGTTDSQAAGGILSTAGYNAVVNFLGPDPVSIDLDHTWVEAYLDSGLRPAFWLAMDPSFKRHTLTPAVDPVAVSGATSGAASLATLFTHGEVDLGVPVVRRWDAQAMDDNLRASRRQIIDWFSVNQPATRLIDWLARANKIDEPIARPPKWLAFEVLGASDVSTLPTGQRHTIRFQTSGIDVSLDLPAIAGERVSLSYVAASSADQALIDGFGGILRTPPLGALMVPELRIDGSLVAQGLAQGIGSFDGVQIDFFDTNGYDGSVIHNVTYGGTYALALDTQHVSPDKLQAAADRLQLAATGVVGEGVLAEPVLGELLHMLGMIYFGHQDLSIGLEGGLSNAAIFHQVNEALIGRDLRARLGGTGLRMALGGITIDAQRTQYSVVSRSNDPTLAVPNLLFALGTASSSLEAYMLRAGMGWSAVSTTRVLQTAVEEEVPIYTIDASNEATVLPLIQASPNSLASIAASIAQGLRIIVPAQELQIGDWQGTAWIAFDPATGTGGFLLSGGLAGGAGTVSSPNDPVFEEGLIVEEIADANMLLADATTGPLGLDTWMVPIVNAETESALTRDLSGVRVHTDSQAAGALDATGAGAFTVGTDTVFEGEANNDTLVPHESIHSVQQQSSGNLQAFTDFQAVSGDADEVLTNLHEFGGIGTTNQTTLGSITTTVSQGVRAGTPIDYMLVSNGAGLLSNLGQNPADGSPANREQIAAAVADSVAQLRGWTRLDTVANAAQGEMNRVYQKPNGEIVIVQTDFVEGGHQIGVSRLDVNIGGTPQTELTDEWLLGATPGQGALDRALAGGSLGAAAASAVTQARNNGTLRRELLVVGNQHHGNTVSLGLAGHVELGSSGANSVSTTLIELPDGTVAPN